MNSVKKLCLLCLLFNIFFRIYCNGNNKTVLDLLNSLQKPIGFHLEKGSVEVAYFVYRNSENYELIWEGSGYPVFLTNVEINDTEIILNYFKMWIGAEEHERGERRMIYKYKTIILKKNVVNSINGLDNTIQVLPYIIIRDSPDSVKENKKNHLLKTTDIKFLPCEESFTIKKVAGNEQITIIDVDGEQKSGYWFKIKCGEVSGWVPLDCVSEGWTVKEDTVNQKNDRFYAVNDDRVRIREEPNLTGKTLGHLNRKNKVRVIEHSDNKEKIENMESYWYRVQTDGGLTGWVYGAYIDIDSE